MFRRKGLLKHTGFLSVILVFSILLSLVPQITVNADGGRGKESANAHNHNYRYGSWYSQWNWAEVSNSYLYNSVNGPVRVEAINSEKKILIEQYSQTLKYQDGKEINFELPIFGGFYCGKDAYYLMFGQQNDSESDSCEVVRIVKYDTSWNRIGSVSYYGINTYIPFDAGASDFAEYENILYVRTCHEMYQSSDGYHHQANMTFAIDTDTMTSLSSYTRVMNYTCGYVSHSFNQFIRVDGKDIIALDHGDAYPRGLLLGTYKADASKAVLDTYGGYTSINVLPIPGNIGANYTGTSVGALEISKDNYMVAASRVEYDSNFASNKVRNVVLLLQPKGNFTSSTKEIKFTSFAEGSGSGCGNPYLVKISDNYFVLMWDLLDTTNSGVNTANYTGRFQAVAIDGNGNKISDIKTFEGELSDCKPVVINNKVVWYTTGQTQTDSWGYSNVTSSIPYFYIMDLDSNSLNTQIIDSSVGLEEEINNNISEEQTEQVKMFVKRLYLVLLERDAEEDGLNDWTSNLISKKKTGAQVAEGIVDSEEFQMHKYSDEEYVKKLYLAFFDREADEDGFNGWVKDLKNGKSRKQVLAGFIESVEFKELCKKYGIEPGKLDVPQTHTTQNNQENNSNKQQNSNMLKVDASNADRTQVRSFVERLYLKILGREGEEAGIEDWTNTIMNSMDTGGTAYDAGTVISKGFFTSEEYGLKNTSNEQFVIDCYAAFFNREPDEAGYNDWVSQLNNKTITRKEVIERGFGTSEEFKNLLTSYGFKVLN